MTVIVYKVPQAMARSWIHPGVLSIMFELKHSEGAETLFDTVSKVIVDGCWMGDFLNIPVQSGSAEAVRLEAALARTKGRFPQLCLKEFFFRYWEPETHHEWAGMASGQPVPADMALEEVAKFVHLAERTGQRTTWPTN